MQTAQHAIEEAIEQLKERGIRMTPQRLEIIRLLNELSHPTPEQLYHAFLKKYPHVSFATIYNNLKVLKEHGYILELTFGDHSSRFEWAIEPHYHFSCTTCGGITDMEIPEISDKIERMNHMEAGYHVHSHRLELYGTCPKCLS